jgi:hypothetical protein
MREINKIAEGLFEKIRDRFEDVSLGDDKAKATTDPESARFFNFDYVVDDHDHGNITISLIDETSLKVYFSKNISGDLDDEHKREWYSFLRELREFAKRNLLSFEPRDITRSTLKHRDLQQVSKSDDTYTRDDVVSESLYGTRRSSYEKKGPVRIIVRHSQPILDEENRRARAHHINNIYVENQDGERFKMPVKSLKLARAVAQHFKQGGNLHDDLGRHICEMAMEAAKLKPFLNKVRHRTFEDTQTHAMVEAAFEYHGLLNNTLKRMTGKKGYKKCAEQFVATSTSYIPEVDTDEMKERFVKRTFDDRLEEALPLVHKAYNMKKENKFAEQFESWADTVSEGTWAVPDSDDEVGKLIDLLNQPLPVGVDGQNATNALYNIVGDDRLFDRLGELADSDPEADARDVVVAWLQDNLPQIYQQIENEIGDPDVPAEPAEDTQEVDESADLLVGKVTELLKRFEENAMEIGAYGDPDINEIIKHLKNGDSEAAAEAVWYSYSDQDGGEVPQIEPYIEDLKAEFDELTGQETTMESNEDEDDDGGFEAIQSAIIRRIAHRHHDLLMKIGPDGVLEAARHVAEFAAPVEEIGSSDVSAWVDMIEREAGIEQEDELAEAKDKVTYDPKTGKLTGWEHEGDWKKQTKKKDPVGKIHHMSDVARRRTEKMAKDETLEEAFERLVNEGAINIGDMIKDKTQPEISGKVVGDMDENYIIQVEDDQYHVKKLNAEKVAKEAIEMPDNPDYSGYDKPTFQRKGIIPGQPTKSLPGIKPAGQREKQPWAGYNTDEPAYKRKEQHDLEQKRINKMKPANDPTLENILRLSGLIK